MKNLKFVFGFSIFGFLLSFISGLFSRSGFGRIFFHALIFAVVFALLALILNFVFDKFLGMEYEPAPEAAAGEPYGVAAGTAAKHSVDFYVEDEDLPSEDDEAQFYVGNSHQMLSEADIADEKNNKEENSLLFSADTTDSKVAEQNRNSAGFVPVSLADTPGNFSGTESKSIGEINNNEKKYASVEPEVTVMDNDEPLDVLPDLEQISSSASGNGPHVEQETDDGKDDFVPGSVYSGPAKDADEIAEGQDATLMAKAISTLLAKDN